ncbi:MAG: DUF6531 domain-containing protein, partial [Candidatus Omnitrophica bacterium]|nr:DUF6531 domain-containing protein [Candidatus Omnitrophota bacterium]
MKRRILSLLILGFFIFDCLIAPYAYGCWYKPALWARSEANGKGPNTGDTRGHLHPSMPIGGDPVYLHNGEFVYTKQDVFIPSKGMPLDIQRTYRSQSPDNGPFGYGWSLSYYERIVQRADGSAVWIDGKGSEHVFSHSYGGNFNKPAYLQETLVLEQDGTWILTSKNQLVRTFNVNGHLSSITDRNGNSMSFTYSAQKQAVNGGSPFVKSSLVLGLFLVGYVYHLTGITDTAGRSTTLAYNDDGRLESITDSAGRVTSYSYDSLGNLLSVTYPATDAFGEGTTIEYSYTGTNLEIITDAKDQVYIENFYNAQDKVESQTSGNNTWYFTYDEDGRETEVEDANGNRVVYSLDYRGLLVEKEEYTRGYRDGEPSKYVTTYVYGRWDPRIITLPGGNQVRYDYDTYDNIVRKKLVPAPGSSDPTLITEFSYEYEYNFIKTREDPRGNITTYYYDYEEASSGDLNGDGVTDGNEGNLVKISYPSAGGTTPEVKLQYNDAGQVTKVIDANGLVTEYQYSAAAGYLTRVIRDPAGLALTTEMTYDSAGNVLTVKDPRGYITTFTYDEHNNLLQAQAPAPWNHLVKYTYDANDNLVRIERQTSDAGNPWETSEFTYDILDRVTSYTNDLNQTISVTYDGNGNRAGITDAANKSVQYVYDERDLLLNATDAQGYTTTYNYNNNSDLNELVDARGNEVAFYHDSYDRFNRSYQAGGVDEYYSYDNASNLVNLNNSASRSISYSYDALNRLTQKSYAGGGSVNYTYDAGSRLTDAVSDNSTINYTYDNASRVTQVADGNRTVQYEYDNSSNLVKLTYPDSSYITYTYDELNRLKAIKNQAGQEVVNYTYDNLSRRSKAALLNGMEALYDYDAAGRLISLTNRIASNQTMVSQYNYTYDAAGNRLSMQTLNGTHNYTYDDSYQLTGVTYPAGHFAGNTTYGYDEVGNRQWVDV